MASEINVMVLNYSFMLIVLSNFFSNSFVSLSKMNFC